jgi:cobalt-zinc-cadmium efflux system outer membrane protein
VSLCAILVGLMGSSGLAQRALGPVTIDEAVDEAVQHNLSLLAERAHLSVAEAARITASLRPNPVVSVSADHLDLLGTGFDQQNNGGPAEIAWRVDVPIERGGKREARLAVASAIHSAAEADVAEAVRSLRLEVRLACVDLLAAQATRALLDENLRTFENLVQVNQARLAAGAIAPFETTRSQVAMLQFRSTVVRAELDAAAAGARLRTLLGRAPTDALDLGGSLKIDAPPDPAPADVSRLTEMALAARPDLQSLQFAQTRSLADLRLQEALGRVDYTLGAEYRRQQGISGRSNSLGFFVSAPLPVMNRNQGEIARAAAEGRETDRQIAARRAQVASDVAASYHELSVTRDLLTSIETQLLAPAASARDISAYTYSAGGSTLLELLDAQRAFNDTMQSYVDAQAAVRRAMFKVNAAVGMEVLR